MKNKREERNSEFRRIPNSLSMYSTLKFVQYNFPVSKCDLNMTFLQRVQYGVKEREVNLQQRNPVNDV
jgi:hypothetical protein